MPQPSSLSWKVGRSGLLIRTRSAEPLLCARPFRGARLAASPGGGVRSKGLPQSPVSGKARGSTGLTGNSCFFPTTTVLKGDPSWMTRALPRFGLAEAGNRFILHAPHTWGKRGIRFQYSVQLKMSLEPSRTYTLIQGHCTETRSDSIVHQAPINFPLAKQGQFLGQRVGTKWGSILRPPAFCSSLSGPPT